MRGEWIELQNMEDSHLRNTVKMLHRRMAEESTDVDFCFNSSRTIALMNHELEKGIKVLFVRGENTQIIYAKQ